jgi:hypothetical protein
MASKEVNNTRMKTIMHLDEKVLKPQDRVGSGKDITLVQQTKNGPLRESLQKSVIGRPKVYDLKGNLLADEENLVVLLGREFLAQLIAMRPGDNPLDYTKYKVLYFGVGDGGTSNDCPPQTVGPYDNDTDLENRYVIKDPAAGADAPDYIDNGKLKRIELDGSIDIVVEEHTINTDNGGQITVNAFTAVKYVMYLQPGEPVRQNNSAFFRFNEAGLYAVEYDDQGNLTGNTILFARFTTLDKYLEAQDGIMIEWYILV